MKTIEYALIGCAHLSGRIVDLLEKSNEDIMENDLTIYCKETADDYFYKYDDDTKKRWLNQLRNIYPSLISNLKLLGNTKFISKYPKDEDRLPEWTKPRLLINGELSVISKHHRAMKNFLKSSNDYLLVMEDDVILKKNALKKIKKLVNENYIDYIDLAGGDGLKATEENTIIMSGLKLENKLNRATRTACSYLVSRKIAKLISRDLNKPTMPIDWSISYSLSNNKERIKVYWLDEDLFEHGSSIGAINSWRNE